MMMMIIYPENWLKEFFFFLDRKRNSIRREENVQKRIRHPQIDIKETVKT